MENTLSFKEICAIIKLGSARNVTELQVRDLMVIFRDPTPQDHAANQSKIIRRHRDVPIPLDESEDDSRELDLISDPMRHEMDAIEEASESP